VMAANALIRSRRFMDAIPSVFLFLSAMVSA
jgi:hypothetical protein